MKVTKLFFDTEFTGLHQQTTLVSIGIVSYCGKTFYAELTDYDKSQIDDWLQKNVIDNLSLPKHVDVNLYHKHFNGKCKGDVEMNGTVKDVRNLLTLWIEQFDKVEFWSDCLSYDWVLFCQIFDHAFNIPKNIFYIPFDICTVLKLKDINPDINREEFANYKGNSKKHNSLHDAKVIKACYLKLSQ